MACKRVGFFGSRELGKEAWSNVRTQLTICIEQGAGRSDVRGYKLILSNAFEGEAYMSQLDGGRLSSGF
jgi:hypothetical protein